MITLSSDWQDLDDGFRVRMGEVEDHLAMVYFRKGDMEVRTRVDLRFEEDQFQDGLEQRLNDWKQSIEYHRRKGNLDDYDENGFLINNIVGE